MYQFKTAAPQENRDPLYKPQPFTPADREEYEQKRLALEQAREANPVSNETRKEKIKLIVANIMQYARDHYPYEKEYLGGANSPSLKRGLENLENQEDPQRIIGILKECFQSFIKNVLPDGFSPYSSDGERRVLAINAGKLVGVQIEEGLKVYMEQLETHQKARLKEHTDLVRLEKEYEQASPRQKAKTRFLNALETALASLEDSAKKKKTAGIRGLCAELLVILRTDKVLPGEVFWGKLAKYSTLDPEQHTLSKAQVEGLRELHEIFEAHDENMRNIAACDFPPVPKFVPLDAEAVAVAEIDECKGEKWLQYWLDNPNPPLTFQDDAGNQGGAEDDESHESKKTGRNGPLNAVPMIIDEENLNYPFYPFYPFYLDCLLAAVVGVILLIAGIVGSQPGLAVVGGVLLGAGAYGFFSREYPGTIQQADDEMLAYFNKYDGLFPQ